MIKGRKVYDPLTNTYSTGWWIVDNKGNYYPVWQKEEKQMDEIIICKHCGKPEYYGEMRWLSGRCSCRNCYKSQWQDENHKLYSWDDLDGKRPTMEEYEKQER